MAPLKQGEIERALAELGEFPRLQKRGPIEALSDCGSDDIDVASFHAYKSVAPLKLGNPCELDAAIPSFHAYKSVAPLKLPVSIYLAARHSQFPRLQKRGPIEAPPRLTSSSGCWRVSTLTKAWPH